MSTLLLGIVLIEHMTARLTAKWFSHNDNLFIGLKSSVPKHEWYRLTIYIDFDRLKVSTSNWNIIEDL